MKMISNGYPTEANFCKIIKEGLYVADDKPGISAVERCNKRLCLIKWLAKDVDFGIFPPYSSRIKGLSWVLYEGLRSSQEAKLYLYSLAKSGTYCVRAPNTLCSESFFGSMQEMDPWGQGILSKKGVEKHMSDFTTITAMKMEENRNIYIKTKADAAYPVPKLTPRGELTQTNPAEMCECREKRFIRCIIPRDHYFDTEERERLTKEEKPYAPGMSGHLKGEQPIRAQFGYKLNEVKMPPSTLLGISEQVYNINEYLKLLMDF